MTFDLDYGTAVAVPTNFSVVYSTSYQVSSHYLFQCFNGNELVAYVRVMVYNVYNYLDHSVISRYVEVAHSCHRWIPLKSDTVRLLVAQ